MAKPRALASAFRLSRRRSKVLIISAGFSLLSSQKAVAVLHAFLAKMYLWEGVGLLDSEVCTPSYGRAMSVCLRCAHTVARTCVYADVSTRRFLEPLFTEQQP